MLDDKSLLYIAGKNVVAILYSYAAIEKMKGTLPLTVIEYLLKNYSIFKSENRYSINSRMRLNMPEGLDEIDFDTAYSINVEGVVCKEYGKDMSWSATTLFCHKCWSICKDQFECNKDVTVKLTYNPESKMYEGFEMYYWPINHVCIRCEKIVFEIEWKATSGSTNGCYCYSCNLNGMSDEVFCV